MQDETMISSFQTTFSSDQYTFVINDQLLTSNLVEAIALSPAVSDQLLVDCCARQFVISDDEIDAQDFLSLQTFLSGQPTHISRLRLKSLLRLCQLLCNPNLEQFFFLLLSFSLPDSDLRASLSMVVSPQLPIDLRFVSHLSLLSFDAIDSLLSGSLFELLSPEALLTVAAHVVFPPEPLWHRLSRGLLQPSAKASPTPPRLISVRASSEFFPDRRFAENAFGEDNWKFWATDGSSRKGQWIEAQFEAPVAFRRVTLKARSDQDVFQTPTQFSIEGSDDGRRYNHLATLKTTSWELGDERTFEFDNNVKYARYRLIPERGESNHFAISKIRYSE
jgi:hypothetical protein